MIESLYTQQIAARWHRLHVRLGMLKAGVRDGDKGLYAALWFEVRFEAERELLRIGERIKEVQRSIYV